MSSVLPIDTQRYESGDYTLEVTAYPSPLSQWSDRPVVRQLRFNLWSNQQRLATGDQQQLVDLSDTVETYVQRHLTHEAWPSTHRLQLLGQNIELSTLQLFNLAEVFSAYGQRQITLPVATVQQPRQRARQRRRWWTGSAAASLLAAMGVATAYLQHRPAAFNQVETAQAPEVTFEEGVAADADIVAPQDASAAESLTEAVPEQENALDSRVQINRDEGQADSRATDRSVSQQPLELEALPDDEVVPAPTVTPAAEIPPADSREQAEAPPAVFEQSDVAAAPAPSAAPEAPAKIAPAIAGIAEEPVAESVAEEEELDSADFAADSAAGVERAARVQALETMGETLDAIATQLAPAQPTDVTYPLVYHLQVSPDGTITAIEAISEDGPAIAFPEQVITPAPGRFLRVELIYTGANRPVVNELVE